MVYYKKNKIFTRNMYFTITKSMSKNRNLKKLKQKACISKRKIYFKNMYFKKQSPRQYFLKYSFLYNKKNSNLYI